jgi:hypothetical protein
MPMRTFLAGALTALLLATLPAAAHEAAKGRNGGWRVDAGMYHTELLVDGTTKVAIFVSDVDDKPLPAAGFKATAILIVGGKTQRFPLEPAEGSKLVGTSPVPVKPGVKGVIQITAPDGAIVQGKF